MGRDPRRIRWPAFNARIVRTHPGGHAAADTDADTNADTDADADG
ncbi:MAG: hypothetical protein ACYTBZ_18695 [Planctomycetota bacterium]